MYLKNIEVHGFKSVSYTHLAFHQKTSKSTKSINYFATAQYSLGGSGVYREFCFFSIYTGLYLEAAAYL